MNSVFRTDEKTSEVFDDFGSFFVPLQFNRSQRLEQVAYSPSSSLRASLYS